MSVETAQVVLLGGVFLVVLVFLIGVVYFGAGFTNAFSGITEQLSSALQTVTATFTSLAQFLVSSLTSFSGYLVRAFRSFVLRVTNGFNSVFQFLRQQLEAIIGAVSRVVITLASQITRFIIEGFFNVVNSALTLTNQLVQMSNALLTKLTTLITQGVSIIFNLISQAITKGVGYIGEIITTLIGIVGAGISAVLTGIAAGVDAFGTAIDFTRTNIIDPGLVFISNAWTEIKNEIDNLPNQFEGFICKGIQCTACALCKFCRLLQVPGFSICPPQIPFFPHIPCLDIPPIPLLGSSCDPLCHSVVCPGYPVCPCIGCGFSGECSS
jgi:phage-related protein